jgi:hypothetical protein
LGPESKPLYKALQSALLVANASKHFAHIVMSFAKLLKSGITLCTSL